MFDTTEETGFAGAVLRRLKRIVATQIGSLAEIPPDTRGPLEKYCPHTPWPKQKLFLSLTCEEAFYGGAAGPGKTDALLMAALQYVHVAGYSALILRRDTQRLALAGAIMDRAKSWLLHRTDAEWHEQKKTFTFPSGATLQFGYIDNPDDRYRYASAEYQFIAFEELTEFRLPNDEDAENNPYLFMFSRLRRTVDNPVPLRIRSASNPGNIGHAWVKKRFVPPDFTGITPGDMKVFDVAGRKFVPALIDENKSIPRQEYEKTLSHLPPVTRARLLAGDWQIAESLQIPDAWLLTYAQQGDLMYPLDAAGNKLPPIDERDCRRFATVDTAGTSRDKAEESKGKPRSWSVCEVWDFDRAGKRLFLRNVLRQRFGWNELKLRVPEFLRLNRCNRVKVENAHVGQPLYDELRAAGFQAELVGPTLPGMIDGWRGAKLERAIASGFLTMLEQGRIFIPKETGLAKERDWLPSYRLELTSWTGAPDETCDQIDASSYAAWEVKSKGSAWGGVI